MSIDTCVLEHQLLFVSSLPTQATAAAAAAVTRPRRLHLATKCSVTESNGERFFIDSSGN